MAEDQRRDGLTSVTCPSCTHTVGFYGESNMLVAHWTKKGLVCSMSLRMLPGPLFQAAKKAYKESVE